MHGLFWRIIDRSCFQPMKKSPPREKEGAVLNIGFRIFRTCLLRSSRFPLHYGGETGAWREKSQFGAANRTPLAPPLDQQGASSLAVCWDSKSI